MGYYFFIFVESNRSMSMWARVQFWISRKQVYIFFWEETCIYLVVWSEQYSSYLHGCKEIDSSTIRIFIASIRQHFSRCFHWTGLNRSSLSLSWFSPAVGVGVSIQCGLQCKSGQHASNNSETKVQNTTSWRNCSPILTNISRLKWYWQLYCVLRKEGISAVVWISL